MLAVPAFAELGEVMGVHFLQDLLDQLAPAWTRQAAVGLLAALRLEQW